MHPSAQRFGRFHDRQRQGVQGRRGHRARHHRLRRLEEVVHDDFVLDYA